MRTIPAGPFEAQCPLLLGEVGATGESPRAAIGGSDELASAVSAWKLTPRLCLWLRRARASSQVLRDAALVTGERRIARHDPASVIG